MPIEHIERSWVPHMVYIKIYETSFSSALIDGEQGMTRKHTAYADIHLGSGTLWVWQRPRRGSGALWAWAGPPPDAARVGQPTFDTEQHLGSGILTPPA